MIHAVWPYFIKLKKDFAFMAESGSPFSKALGKSAKLAFEHKQRLNFITKYHKACTFLHPAKRNLDNLECSVYEKDEVNFY